MTQEKELLQDSQFLASPRFGSFEEPMNGDSGCSSSKIAHVMIRNGRRVRRTVQEVTSSFRL